MKKVILISCFLLFHFLSFSQDTIEKKTGNNIQIAIKVGGYYKYFFGERYIEPTPYNIGDGFQNHQYEKFTKIPTCGFYGGLLITHLIHKNWYLTSGLMFSYRKNIFNNNQDTIIKYSNGSNFPDIHNTLDYDYTYYSIEIPILLMYKFKKMKFYAGVHLPILTFYKAKYTYVINQFPQNPSWGTFQKTISGTTVPLFSIPSLFPSVKIQTSPSWQATSTPASPKINYDMPLVLATFQVSYDFKIKNLYVSPFLGIDIGTKKSFYLQGGLIFPLHEFSKKSKTIKTID
ncbi:MAG TPA: outer membrane beta-barrel protein [Bacteroidia bacterium]|nr:outer membrane beta-barrel protein [Bacteroidia bacterium]